VTRRAPLPPEVLIRRVGWDLHSRHPAEVYEERGREQWRLVKSLLPQGWTLEGRRVLDFGSGAGRIVRHALAEEPGADYWACDIDARSIAWMQAHLSPLHAFQADEWPPTHLADGQFDLIFAFSVFTHLVDSWSAWLLELRRILAADGVMIVTVFGPGISMHGDIPVSEDKTGMNLLAPGTEWDAGGPMIVHSEWWLRAHWGRAFEITDLRRGNPAGAPPLLGQSILVMRKRPGSLTRADLERASPNEPRELAAAQQNIATLRHEVERLGGIVRVYATSRSWRLTAPLRAIARLVRAHRPSKSHVRASEVTSARSSGHQ